MASVYLLVCSEAAVDIPESPHSCVRIRQRDALKCDNAIRGPSGGHVDGGGAGRAGICLRFHLTIVQYLQSDDQCLINNMSDMEAYNLIKTNFMSEISK